MDTVDAQKEAEAAQRAAVAAALRQAPPRSPTVPPPTLRNELVGTYWVLAIGLVLLVLAFFVGHGGFIAVILGYLAIFTGLALSRLRLSFAIWRRGVVARAKIIEDVTITKKYIRNGQHVDTGFYHKIRMRYTDTAGRPCDAAFDTVEQRYDSPIHQEALDLVYTPGRRFRPWRGVVILPNHELRVCALLRPGGSTSMHMFVSILRLILWIGALYAVYLFVPGVRYAVAMSYYHLTGDIIPFPF